MPETWLLIVRHPETEANVTGRFVGRGASPYTAEGRREARRLPGKIAAFRPDAILTSPLERARTVAERAGRHAHVPVTVDERLCELDFGDAEGMTYEEIAEAGMSFNYRSVADPVAPGGESRASIAARSGAVADELVARGGRFAVVAHGGVVRSMITHLLGLPGDAIWSFHVHNAQLATVHVVEGHGSLEEYVRG